MKNIAPAAIVHQRFVRIGDACSNMLSDAIRPGDDRIRDSYETEDIHRLRVEVKKLRAFLHLAAPDRKPALPVALHHFYGIGGRIRNFQLQRRRVACECDGAERPEVYLVLLQQAIEEAIAGARLFADGQLHLEREEEDVQGQLPGRLSDKHIHEFLWKADRRIRKLTAPDAPLDDEAMHELRKCLKDLLYTRDYLTVGAEHLLPPALLGGKEKIGPFTTALGEFQDLRAGLDLLGPNYLDRIPDQRERKMLAAIRRRWEKKKEVIQERFRHFQLPIFQKIFS